MSSHIAATSHSKRRNATDRKIFLAVLSIATTEGLGAVTIEEVARRSGVAKTTIYRRYTNTDEMLDSVSSLDIFDDMQCPVILPEPSRESFEQLCAHMEAVFTQSIGVHTVGIVLSNQHIFFRNILHAVVLPVINNLHHYFSQGIAAGIFRTTLDIDMLTSMIVGSLVAFYAGQSLDIPRQHENPQTVAPLNSVQSDTEQTNPAQSDSALADLRGHAAQARQSKRHDDYNLPLYNALIDNAHTTQHRETDIPMQLTEAPHSSTWAHRITAQLWPSMYIGHQ